MENKKRDLRIEKTEMLIKQSFISLLKQKPYSKITVTDIVTKSMINRNTFYLHYIDKEDLLDKVMEESYNKYFQRMQELIIQYKNSELKLQYVIYNFLTTLDPDLPFYRSILKDNEMKGYFLKGTNFLRKVLDNQFTAPNKYSSIVIEHLYEGTFGLFIRWLDGDKRLGSKEDFSFAMSNIISDTIERVKNFKDI